MIQRMNSLLGYVFMLVFAGRTFVEGLQHQDELRIVKGTTVGAHEKPYQVVLMENFYDNRPRPRVCSGILVAEKWILTVSSCLSTFDKRTYDIIIGSNKWCEGIGSNFTRKYDDGVSIGFPSKHRFQIGAKRDTPYFVMVKFTIGSTKGDPQPPAKLAFELPKDGDMFEVSGWGKIHTGQPAECDMRKATVPIVNSKECSESYAGIPMYGTEFCAGFNETRKPSAYSRDEGSPLVKDGMVYGLVSRVKPKGKPGSPSLYLPFAPYKEWISLFTSGKIDNFAQSSTMDCRVQQRSIIQLA